MCGVELVEDLDQHLMVGGRKRRVVGDVLQRHLGVLPNRAHHAHVYDAVLHGRAGFVELVERAAVVLTPTNLIFVAAFLQQLVHLGLEHLLHGIGPNVGGGVAGADVHIDRLLRVGGNGGQAGAHGQRAGERELHQFHEVSLDLRDEERPLVSRREGTGEASPGLNRAADDSR